MSKTYKITTDSGTTTTQAANVRDALAKAGIQADSAAGFRCWLEEVGGYGTITEDGVVIARVSA
jgi:hypothetical protein